MLVLSDLHQFIRFLKELNIRPILFSSPTYREYNRHLESAQTARNLHDASERYVVSMTSPTGGTTAMNSSRAMISSTPITSASKVQPKFSRILDERLGEWSEVSDQQSRR